MFQKAFNERPDPRFKPGAPDSWPLWIYLTFFLFLVFVYGFKGLLDRLALQDQQVEKQKDSLNRLGQNLDSIIFDQSLSQAIANLHAVNAQLYQQLLRILGKIECLRIQQSNSFFHFPEEGGFRAALEQLQREIDRPLSDLYQIRHQVELQDDPVYQPPSPNALDPKMMVDVLEFLKQQQSNILHLIEILKKDLELCDQPPPSSF